MCFNKNINLLFDEQKIENQYNLICGDTSQEIKLFENNKFDLIITSPPYNVGKEYETKTSIENYLEYQEEIIKNLIRILSNKGSICWQIGNYVDKGEGFPFFQNIIFKIAIIIKWYKFYVEYICTKYY